MLILENILLAFNSLLSNKMRALLTMLGIIIGIGSVIAIITVGNSLTLSISENMQSMGANDIYVMVEERQKEESSSEIDGVQYGSLAGSSYISEDDYITQEMIQDLCNRFEDEIYAINVQSYLGTGEASYSSHTANVEVIGNSVGYYVTNKLNILAGRMFSASDFDEMKNVTIVSDKLVDKLFEGDVNRALGKEVQADLRSQSVNLTIIGVYKNEDVNVMGMNMSSNNLSMYIPLKTAMTLNHSKIVFPYLQISTKVGVNADELSLKIENFFKPYYQTNHNCHVTTMTMGSMVSMMTDMLSTITLAISIVAGIALLVGGIGVMNIMLVSITERTREIGTRKALGAKNSSIRTQFIVEAMIICLIGGMFGITLGIGGGILISNLLGYPAQPSIASIVISLVFSMSIGVFFGYYPANKAAKMNPIDALRYE